MYDWFETLSVLEEKITPMKTETTSLLTLFNSAICSITMAYLYPEESNVDKADRDLKDISFLDETMGEAFNEYSYALWAGPSANDFSCDELENLESFVRKVQDGNPMLIEASINHLSFAHKVVCKAFYNRTRNFYNN